MKSTQKTIAVTKADQTQVRKQRFRAALALAGLTQQDWAARHGISAGHLSNVLSGRFQGVPVWGKIDAFTVEWLDKRAA